MWILRINVSDLSYKLEAVPEKYRLLYGRGLTSQIVYDEVPRSAMLWDRTIS